jgi:hypothetical protein
VAEKVTLKLSADAAALIRRDASKKDKLQAARGEVLLAPGDLGNILLVLSHDPDRDIKEAAVGYLKEMSESSRSAVASAPETHPKVIELFSRFHPLRFSFTEEVRIPSNEACSCSEVDTQETIHQREDHSAAAAEIPVGTESSAVEEGADGNIETVNEDSEEFKSKYKLCMELGISDKIKYALTGDKEWRSILIKDSNKLVSGAVIKNPRITEGEVLTIAKSKIQNDEILRIICMNKDWLKNYQIRKALVENAKTPLPKALRFMTTLTERDISSLAKSKNVSSAISTQARRISVTRK